MSAFRPFTLRTALILTAAASAAFADRTANDTSNAQDLQPGGGFNLTGAGVTVGVFEAGDTAYLVRNSHQEFIENGVSRVTIGKSLTTGAPIAAGYSDHATGVASTIAGNGVGGSTYVGAAPGARVISYGSGGFIGYVNRDFADLDITNGSYSVGSPNGWGDAYYTTAGSTTLRHYSDWHYGTTNTAYYRDKGGIDYEFGQYSSTSRSTDALIYDHPKVLSFFSAGNTRGNLYLDYQNNDTYVAKFSAGFVPVNGVKITGRATTSTGTVTDVSAGNYWLVSTADYLNPTAGGYDTVSHVSATKNTLVIGATVGYTTDPQPKSINSTIQTTFSNYGPTDDGRLGVMLMADGNGMAMAMAGGDADYGTNSGTSFSSPSAAGTAALLLQLWRQKGRSPDAAMQKALLIHTATDIAGGGQVGPDYRTGYGLINGLKAARFVADATQTNAADRTDHAIAASIKNGQALTYTFASTGEDVTATLVWTDPEGVAHSGSAYVNDHAFRSLVNDLDVWITDAAGKTYFPWTLDPSNPANAAVRTKRNDVDNTEQVYVDAGVFRAGGVFTVHVGLDGVLGSGTTQQAYSLLVSNGALVPEPAALATIVLGGTMLLRRKRAN